MKHSIVVEMIILRICKAKDEVAQNWKKKI
jgi:hypothetical protein